LATEQKIIVKSELQKMPSLFKGRVMAIVRAGKTELRVTSAGVSTATIVINLL
jgi:hypothetical protein